MSAMLFNFLNGVTLHTPLDLYCLENYSIFSVLLIRSELFLTKLIQRKLRQIKT